MPVVLVAANKAVFKFSYKMCLIANTEYNANLFLTPLHTHTHSHTHYIKKKKKKKSVSVKPNNVFQKAHKNISEDLKTHFTLL